MPEDTTYTNGDNMRRTEPVEITREYIMKHRTKRGSWTRVQVLALGINWPPHQGWIDEVIGNVLTAEQANQFETGKTKTASTIRKESKKQNVRSSIKDSIEFLENNYSKINNDDLMKLVKVVGNVRQLASKRR
jgi:hypothetical protein